MCVCCCYLLCRPFSHSWFYRPYLGKYIGGEITNSGSNTVFSASLPIVVYFYRLSRHMKKLKNESALVSEAIKVGERYAQARKVGEFSATDSFRSRQYYSRSCMRFSSCSSASVIVAIGGFSSPSLCSKKRACALAQ